MKKNNIFLTCILILVLLLVGAYYLYDRYADEYKPNAAYTNDKGETTGQDLKSSTPAPDFTVTDRNGKSVSLSDYFGKPIVLNFWASWCPPCKSEMPEFQAAYEKYGSDIQFLMVNMTDGERETVNSAKDFISENGYSFPLFFDTEYEAAIAYSASSLPATYFIDSDGNLKAYAIGALDAENLQRGISKIIK